MQNASVRTCLAASVATSKALMLSSTCFIVDTRAHTAAASSVDADWLDCFFSALVAAAWSSCEYFSSVSMMLVRSRNSLLVIVQPLSAFNLASSFFSPSVDLHRVVL